MHSRIGRPGPDGGLITRDRPVVTLHDHFHALKDLRQDGVETARELGF